jgi:hypothetical protein
MPDYVVKPGDSWAKIAGEVSGDQRQFLNLMNANGGRIMIHPGEVIHIPDQFAPNPVIPTATLQALDSEAQRMGFNNFFPAVRGAGATQPTGGGGVSTTGAGAGAPAGPAAPGQPRMPGAAAYGYGPMGSGRGGPAGPGQGSPSGRGGPSAPFGAGGPVPGSEAWRVGQAGNMAYPGAAPEQQEYNIYGMMAGGGAPNYQTYLPTYGNGGPAPDALKMTPPAPPVGGGGGGEGFYGALPNIASGNQQMMAGNAAQYNMQTAPGTEDQFWFNRLLAWFQRQAQMNADQSGQRYDFWSGNPVP